MFIDSSHEARVANDVATPPSTAAREMPAWQSGREQLLDALILVFLAVRVSSLMLAAFRPAFSVSLIVVVTDIAYRPLDTCAGEDAISRAPRTGCSRAVAGPSPQLSGHVVQAEAGSLDQVDDPVARFVYCRNHILRQRRSSLPNPFSTYSS